MPDRPGFDPEVVSPLSQRLNDHPVYGLRDLSDLRRFMEHHVYSVWDFMSLIKYLQQHIAPVRYPWSPVGDAAVRRFINELVLEEESDAVPGPDGSDVHMSHFELYCGAMAELGADPDRPRRFVEIAATHGIEAALAAGIAPEPSARFMRSTFDFIATDKPHVVAAALAVGREHVIPRMFRSFLRNMGIGADVAPQFHFYLNRHIHLDEDFHGPLSLRMLDLLCAGDPVRLEEARVAARAAIEARIRFWDGVHADLAEAA
nr:DUF3050 domain-containing protein [Thioalkalivibrio sp.]